jgi:serine phosphatase RsbU (regulator of sigma subunit)
MIVPLVCRGHALGALTLVSTVSGRRYTQDDLRLVEDLAGRVAFPIDNARLYEERARVARTLQENLLPPALPAIPGAELAARYYAAAAGADVGGDFYDVFPTGSRSWGLVLGDVSGKGVEAAAITALARHTIRTAAMTTKRPSSVLNILNAALIEQIEDERFCTAVYARVEPRFGRLLVTTACGGHPPPYVVRSDGTVERVECEGALLGLLPDPALVDVTVELRFGDKLILYTDGLVDFRHDGKIFSSENLERLLGQCGKRGVTASADLITETVVEFQDGSPRDDIALIACGVRASIFRVGRRALLTRRSTTDDAGT